MELHNTIPLEQTCGSGTSGRYIPIAELQMVNCSNIDGLLVKGLMIILLMRSQRGSEGPLTDQGRRPLRQSFIDKAGVVVANC